TVKACLNVLAPMIDTMKINKDNMRKAAQKGFINATDLADYLVKKGIPFRSAYKTVGQVVAYCISREKVLESLTIDEYKSFLDVFEDDLYAEIALDNCVQKRNSLGGTSTSSVETQLKNFKL
ncbi:MAG: argininosuccinate lyase, partial [Clostridia bacterium]